MRPRLVLLALGLVGACGDPGTHAGGGAATDGGAEARTDGATGDAGSTSDARSSDSAASSDGGAETSSLDAPAGDAPAGWWEPGTAVLPWQWELDHEIVTTSATDMGTGDTTASGSPATAPAVYDIDGFDNTAADVAALHALGKKVICYVEVGAAESYRPDYAQFPASALGSAVSGYPKEKYLDIRDAVVVSVIEARIAMCAQKGFDGIEPDIDDSYADTTGFPITQSDDVAYLTKLSTYAHSHGVAWGLKNGGDGGDPATFIPAVVPIIDFAVVEEPFYLKTIGSFEPALYGAGKAVFVAEYTNDTTSASTFCPQALADHANAALFDVGLDAKVRAPCQ